MGTVFICNKSFCKPAYMLWSGDIHIRVLCTCRLKRLLHFCCCHISALWRGVVVSRRCTNVWLGRVVVYVCQQNRERGEEGKGGRYGTTETWEQETHAPHFLSPLYQHLALCFFLALLKHPMKALPQINVCASLFFMGLKWGTSSARPAPTPPPPAPSFPLLLHSCVCFEMPQEKLQPLVYITVP